MYDIIGDIHGEAKTLRKLLEELGYYEQNSVYIHNERKAIFTGDYVDGGNDIIECLDIIKSMVDYGSAFAILGNHEFNVLAYYTKDEYETPLREHNTKNSIQIKKTKEAFALNKEKKKYYLKWLRSLPLFIEFPEFRVVHACWDFESIDILSKQNNHSILLSKKYLRKIFKTKKKKYKAVCNILKGKELNLPNKLSLKDNYGYSRDAVRVKWWLSMKNRLFTEISINNKSLLPDSIIPEHLITIDKDYDKNEKPVFFGHYSLMDKAGVQENNICCVDGGISNKGFMVAYRWDGNPVLSNKNTVFVKRVKK
ncbi:MAG: metallophosphoesterase [Marinifilaceae bacterium]|jgi:predicted MPP superfamily phosphohydrolase|nr:metallophosphoesterase [Marinifilaceae bacterium]